MSVASYLIKGASRLYKKSQLMKLMLATLVILVISDGFITHFLIKTGLAREGNPFLENIVGGTMFLVLKILGAFLAAFILWDIYRRWARLGLISCSCFVVLYALIVSWNLSIL